MHANVARVRTGVAPLERRAEKRRLRPDDPLDRVDSADVDAGAMNNHRPA
jgi:hypothetical protein